MKQDSASYRTSPLWKSWLKLFPRTTHAVKDIFIWIKFTMTPAFDPPHRRLNKSEQEMNKAARELCEEDGRLLLNPVKQLRLTLKFVPNLVAISQATTEINRGAESAPPPRQ